MKKSKVETKKTTHNCNSIELAKRVITDDKGLEIYSQGIKYTYNKETNVLTLKDEFCETKYQPLFLDGMIFPFNKRLEPEVF